MDHNDILSDDVQLKLLRKESHIKWSPKDKISLWFIFNHTENKNIIFVRIVPIRNLRSNN